jgi:hypothetical protein
LNPGKKVNLTRRRPRLVELMNRPGGVSRAAAIAAASAAVESLRDQSIEGMVEAIVAIDEILNAGSPIGETELARILRYAERIVTLAETFGYVTLAFAAKSLCDLAQWFLEKKEGKKEPLLVHAKSLRLVLPPKTVTQAEAERILGELSRILMFFGCMPREEFRLKALRKLQLLDTEADARFDRLLASAQNYFEVPIAAISLIDAHRQWFKSKIGLEATETPRSMAFCSYAIEQDGVFVVEDASIDSRFAHNPLVTGPPNIRFYAGAPLRTSDGHNIGTLCVIDGHPRTLDGEGYKRLRKLANTIVKLVEADTARAKAGTKTA